MLRLEQNFQGHKNLRKETGKKWLRDMTKSLKLGSLNSWGKPVGGRRQKRISKAELSFLI